MVVSTSPKRGRGMIRMFRLRTPLIAVSIILQLVLLWLLVTYTYHFNPILLGLAPVSNKPSIFHNALSSLARAPPEVPEPHESQLHFLIPISSPNLQFCFCLKTHLLNDFSPILVNWGIDTGEDRKNKYLKLQGVNNYLTEWAEDIAPDDIIVIVDGFDAWSQLPANMLVERFLASGKRIVLGADKNCFPNEPDSPVCTDIPESPLPPGIYGEDTDKDPVDGNRYKTRPRWVNSGTVIGYAEDIVKLYDSMIHSHVPDDNGESDQRIFAWHYYWGNYSISLDYVNDLFASVAFSEAEMMFMGDPGFAERRGIEPWRPAEYRQQKQEEDCDPDDEGKIVPTSWSGRKFPNITIPRAPVIRNDLTDNIPVFLHFPGVARTFMKEFTKRFWWTVGMENAIQILNAYVMNKNVTIAETGDYLTFRNVCEDYLEELNKVMPAL